MAVTAERDRDVTAVMRRTLAPAAAAAATLDAGAVPQELRSAPAGLSTIEAARRLPHAGPNALRNHGSPVAVPSAGHRAGRPGTGGCGLDPARTRDRHA